MGRSLVRGKEEKKGEKRGKEEEREGKGREAIRREHVQGIGTDFLD